MAQIERIASPITIHYDGRTREFADGKNMAEFGWGAPYAVSGIQAKDNRIILQLVAQKTDDSIGSYF